MSLRQIAEDIGLTVEKRSVTADELGSFEEAGACGTAAIISPIGKIVDRELNKEFIYSKDGEPGPWSTKLYERLLAIQLGEVEDTHSWNTIVE